MKITELRAGNYFNLINRSGKVHIPDSTVFEVVGLNYDYIQCKRRDEQLHEMSTGPYIIGYSDASPIPTTPEWLERAGFKSVDKPMYINRKQYLLQVSNDYVDEEEGEIINSDGTWFDGIGTFNFKTDGSMAVNVLCRGNYVCRSTSKVHELQNLFFALTGKELEFK